MLPNQIDIAKLADEQDEYLRNNKIINSLTPLVSVYVTAYQHAKYIDICLESILSQKTTFTYEIIIGEDGSSDGTRDICKYYAEKHPDKIRLFLRDRKKTLVYDNDGRFIKSLNGTLTLKSARGKYIAICEGDDYWIDPFKLQKQIDILDNNNIVLCFSNARIENQTNKLLNEYYIGYKKDRIIHPKEAIFTAAPTCTLVFKNIIQRFPPWYFFVKSSDYFLRYLLSHEGDFYYLSETLAVYRKHDHGFSRKSDKYYWHLNNIFGYKNFLKECLPEQVRPLKIQIAKNYIYAFFLKLTEKEYKTAFLMLSKALLSSGLYSKYNILLIYSLLIKFFKSPSEIDAF